MTRIVVAPAAECDLLEAGEGAYVNVLTLATGETECRTKVATAMSHYRLQVVDVEDVFLFSEASNVSNELMAIAEELERSQNLQYVRLVALHKFPRVM